MLGIIGFEGYRIRCIIGIEPHERIHLQDILVDLKVEVDIAKAAKTDNVGDTINYVVLGQICKDVALQGNYGLVEAYASDVLDAILKADVSWAWICVRKPGALKDAQCALVELYRSRLDLPVCAAPKPRG